MPIRNKIRGLREIWRFDNRLFLIFARIFFRREKVLIFRYKGIEFINDVAGGDNNGARDVLATPMYSRLMPLMRLSGKLNVLDLGANNGGFPLLLLAQGFEFNRSVSVELNPNTFQRLRFNLERNLNGCSMAVNAAICGTNRKIEVVLGKGASSDNIYANSQSAGLPVEVDGLTFDSLYESYFRDEVVDLCKIDIEGAEFEVLEGPHHAKLSKCRYLIIEIHENDARRSNNILRILKGLGFIELIEPSQSDPWLHLLANMRPSNLN